MSAKALFATGAIVYILIVTAMLYKAGATPVPEVKPTIHAAIQSMTQTGRMEIADLGDSPDEKKKWALLRDVITCESAARWVISEVPGFGYDTGACQINTYYHSVEAARLGYDLFNPSENMLYCVSLYDKHYPAMISGAWCPWEATRGCWEERQGIREKQKMATSR